MVKNVKGIITDFDNTLVQTQKFIKEHLGKTCRKMKCNEPDPQTLQNTLKKNLPFEQIFTELFGEMSGPEVLAAYREDAMVTYFNPTPGALEMVKAAKQKGVPVLIVSNRTNKLAERLVQAGFAPEDFLKIIEPAVKKPSEGAYTEAFAELATNKVQPQETLIIGDSLDDYQALSPELKNNFAAVTTGPNSRDEFIALGVLMENVLDSLAGLDKILA
ncbi:MAG TPA: HAD-IA family hydrolase [Candidatus Dojkabacteria bacterium]|nr:HAD-IA family hydrolase [Candidatus Dojkabacteria bacterium]